MHIERYMKFLQKEAAGFSSLSCRLFLSTALLSVIPGDLSTHHQQRTEDC